VLIGFVVGFGPGIAHRTADVAVIMMIVLEVSDAHPVEGAHPSPGESATGGRWSRHGTLAPGGLPVLGVEGRSGGRQRECGLLPSRPRSPLR